MIEEAVVESMDFEEQIKNRLSISKNDGILFLYSKSSDGEKKLIFSGTAEEFQNFKQSAENFIKELKSL